MCCILDRGHCAPAVPAIGSTCKKANEVSMTGQHECVIGVFPSLSAAEAALPALANRGWSDEQMSLISRGNESDLGRIDGIQHGDRTEKGAAVGSAAGAALGLLAGSSLFIVPGLGPVVFAGAMASGITGGLVGGLVGAMGGWGVHDDHVRQYEKDLKQGKAIVALSGEPGALAEGRAQLLASAAERVVMHAESADTDHVDA